MRVDLVFVVNGGWGSPCSLPEYLRTKKIWFKGNEVITKRYYIT